MSRGFVKDGDQEEVPVVLPRAFLPPGTVNYVTPEGLAALLQEKADLLEQRDRISGNEVDCRVQRNFLNAKLDLLQERITTAVVPDKGDTHALKVGFGSYVTLIPDMGSADQMQILRITGADEADQKGSGGAISFFSPLAKALALHKAGDTVRVNLPSGAQHFKIVAVSDSAPAMPLPTPVPAAPKVPVMPQKSVTPKVSEVPKVPDTPKVAETEVEAPASPNNAPNLACDDPNEIFPIVNERGHTIGRASRWECHGGSKILHPVVHLHLYNSQGQLFLQKRPSWKEIQPDKWDTAVGGHMKFGEKPEAALMREAKEELGIEGFRPVFLKKYVYESSVEKELIHIFTTVYDGPIVCGDELEGGRFWSMEEIQSGKGKKIFTPNLELELQKHLK